MVYRGVPTHKEERENDLAGPGRLAFRVHAAKPREDDRRPTRLLPVLARNRISLKLVWLAGWTSARSVSACSHPDKRRVVDACARW